VLRRLSREGEDLLQLTSPYDNIAPWLVDEWRESWGEEKLTAIADAAMTESPIFLSINQALDATSKEDKENKAQAVKDAFDCHSAMQENSSSNSSIAATATEILPHGSLYIDKNNFPGAVSKWPLYEEGDWWVQDASATLPALALYNSLVNTRVSANIGDDNMHDKDDNLQHLNIVDLCAAPGGKTVQLLSLGFPSVAAVEVSSRRARQLESNLERLNLQDRCEIHVADGSTWIPPGGRESLDGVLLDVPCSATGTCSRRPDVLRRDSNLDSLLEIQSQLAHHAVHNLLAPGGILVYATCSLLRQESEDQILKLLENSEGAQLQLLPFTKGEIPGFDQAIDERGNLRVIPGWLPGRLGACDGFFVARLQKKM